MSEEQIRRLRKGDRVYSESFGGGSVTDVWAISFTVFVDFDDGTHCYYPRRDWPQLELEADAQARREAAREARRRLRPSGLALGRVA